MSNISLRYILSFFGGAERIPAVGFDAVPSLRFDLDPCAVFPTASTCAVELTLPTVYSIPRQAVGFQGTNDVRF